MDDAETQSFGYGGVDDYSAGNFATPANSDAGNPPANTWWQGLGTQLVNAGTSVIAARQGASRGNTNPAPGNAGLNPQASTMPGANRGFGSLGGLSAGVVLAIVGALGVAYLVMKRRR